LGSLKRTFPFLHKHFEIIPEVQINYCFFRSERENQISAKDLTLSGEIFDSLIYYLEPSMLISFSKNLNDYLSTSKKLIHKDTIDIRSGNKTFSVTKGKVKINENEVDYYYLPHPNCPIKGEARSKAWEYCFAGLNP
jgi:ArsR family metal-binding transcriptional regulator